MEDVVVNIVANVHSFNQGLLAAGTAFARFSQQLISDVAKTANAQQQFADSITETYQGLRGLQYAAGTTGVGVEAFNQALTRMNATIGKAAIGNQEAADTLGDLGLNVKELIKLAPQEQFKQIADAVSKVPSGAQRAAITIGIFGRESRQLVNILSSGSAGVDELMKRFDKLSGSHSRFSVAGIDAGRQALEDLGEIFKGIGETVAEKIYPWFKVGLEILEEWGFTGENVGKKLDAAFKSLPSYIKASEDALKSLKNDWNAGKIFQPQEGAKQLGITGAVMGGFENIMNPDTGAFADLPFIQDFRRYRNMLGKSAMETIASLPIGTKREYEGMLFHEVPPLIRPNPEFFNKLPVKPPQWPGDAATSNIDPIFGQIHFGQPFDFTSRIDKVRMSMGTAAAEAWYAQLERQWATPIGGNQRGKTANLGFGLDLSGSLVSAEALARASQEVQEVTDVQGNLWLEKIYNKLGMGAVAS